MSLPTIGFIGLGTMGKPMAANIRKAGYPMVVHDLNERAVAALVAAGATAGGSLQGVASASDVVVTMLPEPRDVEAVALGPGGLLETLRQGGTLIDMSTIDPLTSRRIAAAFEAVGRRMMDCPVGKLQEHAVAGTLVLMAGGGEALVEEMRPLLMTMGETLIHCGPVGCGHAAKLVNNGLATTILTATAEALVSGTKAGLSLDVMRKVFGSTMAANRALEVSLPSKALKGDFAAGFMTRLAHKDVRLSIEMASAMGAQSMVAAATLAALAEAMAQGLGDNDISSVLKLREEQAGVTVRL